VSAAQVVVTAAPFEKGMGDWWMIVRRGDVVEHLHLKDAADAPAVLKRTFGITPARAKRMLEKAART
jgi:hypothetical protein